MPSKAAEGAVPAAPRRLTDRTASREVRRQQLIESTIAEIAENGLAGFKLSEVAKRAGLATGMVNFHFNSKAQLLDQTLEFLTEEYRQCWKQALAAAGPDPAAQLLALMMADLDPVVCTRKRIAVWHAFYGESRAHKAILERCTQREEEHHRQLTAACQAVISRQSTGDACHAMGAARLATGLSAMTDGIWLDLLFGAGQIDRADARRTVLAFLVTIFPTEYTLEQTAAA
jgi:TetR/AcrR family transcriptional repressor of bet genes